MNYIDKIPKEVLEIISILNLYGHKTYLVGGCVRDFLLGDIPHDYDICTTALPEELVRIFNKHHYRMHKKGIKYGTLNLLCDDKEYEVTTLRSSSTKKENGKIVEVEYTKDLKEDLLMRDFTINALALEIVNNETILFDYFGGVEDLTSGIIRATENPKERLETDALRILRAIRFSIIKGYKIEEETKKQMFLLKDGLLTTSKERITDELYKILTSGKPIRKQFLYFKEIIGVIFPELIPCFNFNQNNNHHEHDVYEHMLYVVDYCNTTNFEIKLAALLHDIGKPRAYIEDELGRGHFYGHPEDSYDICYKMLREQLRLPNKSRDLVLSLIRYHDMPINENKKKIKKLLALHGEEMFRHWLILKQADKNDHINISGAIYNCNLDVVKEIMEEIIEEQSCISVSKLKISGKTLIGLGMKQGPEVGVVLKELLMLVVDEQIENEYEVLLEKAKEIIQNSK